MSEPILISEKDKILELLGHILAGHSDIAMMTVQLVPSEVGEEARELTVFSIIVNGSVEVIQDDEG